MTDQAAPWPPKSTAKQQIEIDKNFDTEDDSGGRGFAVTSATTSVSSSIFNFTYANGRRYHSGYFDKADYYMPNDEQEQSRLDLYHHIFLMLLDGALYTAPLDTKKLRRVLDAGTGTGIWAIDMADMHPRAMVIGNDISPIQPSWVPSNLRFEVDDIEEEWTVHEDNYFDYIHMRSLSGSIANWQTLLGNAYKKLAPGGYIEYQDYGAEGFLHDGTPLSSFPPDELPAIGRWFYELGRVTAANGRPITVAKHMAQYFKEAGFVDIKVEKRIWPLSPWPKDPALKEIGHWGLVGAEESVFPFAIMLLTREGWTEMQVKEMCEGAIWELKQGKKKCYAEAYFVVGQKPE